MTPHTLTPAVRNSTSTVPVTAGRAASNTPELPRTAPLFIRADEAYYWSVPWQRDVRESMAALAAGEYEDFDSDDPNDVARWLLSVDEDDC